MNYNFFVQDKDTSREADLILSEVRRKQNEAKRWIDLLDALKELRKLRATAVQSQHGLYAKEEDNSRFATVTDQLGQLMNNQLQTYSKEEQTLEVMMATQKEQVGEADESRYLTFLEKMQKK